MAAKPAVLLIFKRSELRILRKKISVLHPSHTQRDATQIHYMLK